MTGHTSLYVQNIAKSDRVLLTGVAYDDRDGDHFYDVGEGMGGVVFDRVATAEAGTSTWEAGGYTLSLPRGGVAMEAIAVRVEAATMQVAVDLRGENIKLDYLGGGTFASSADLVLGTGATNGLLLGAGRLNLGGNGLDNRLEGHHGINVIRGEAGNDVILGDGSKDTLLGGLGNDTLSGGAGGDIFVFEDTNRTTIGRDSILDFATGDRLRIDLKGTLPDEGRWERAHIDRTADGFKVALGDGGAILVDADLSLRAFENALTLV